MPSATGGIARLVAARLRAAGIPLAPLLSRAGLTVEQIDDPGVRLPVLSQIKILGLAADALHDDLLGFHLAQDYELREIGLLYYVLASSEILADALHRAERYSGITNEGISLQARIGKETVIALSYIDIDRRSDRHQIEFWLISLVRLCRQLTNRRLVPSRVKVMHRRDKTTPEFRSYLGCEIEFGASVDEVVFRRPSNSCRSSAPIRISTSCWKNTAKKRWRIGRRMAPRCVRAWRMQSRRCCRTARRTPAR